MTKEEVRQQALALGLSGELVPLSSVRPNPKNPRVMRDGRFEKLKQSIKEFPKMLELRPMVTEDDGMVLGGNMRQRALKALGYSFIPKEWVKKASDLTEDERRRFIAIDNESFGEWDMDALANEWDTDELKEWGVDGIWDDDVERIVPENYTRKIELPAYTPSEFTPSLSDLTDKEKYNEIVERVNEAELPNDVREFLLVAATRHIKFNYALIGDYYASAPADVQRLMEDSALVIIDIDSAIQKGFVKMTKALAEICAAEKEKGTKDEAR